MMKYIPIKMRLDPSESMNNMGTLRVDVLDAADLPAADRNGYSDPYCKFELNGKDIYKTKTQKKTLHPAWNEYFETPVPSRTAARFKVRVMDWDFGDKADFLGDADINLEQLEPMQAKEITLALNGDPKKEGGVGTAGAIRLRLLFKASYVTRSRQGSSTFSGTIGPAGKVLGAPVKGVGKVGTTVGGGVIKGASFIGRGFKRGDKEGRPGTREGAEVNGTAGSGQQNGDLPLPSIEAPHDDSVHADGIDGSAPASAPGTPGGTHNRASSIGSRSFLGASSASKGDPSAGTAEITVLSVAGYPPDTKLQVLVRQANGGGGGGKAGKEAVKTKAVKAPAGEAAYEGEAGRVACAPDAQFQILVRDHPGVFGHGDDLGEALFYIDDSAQGSEKAVKVGAGSVTVRSRFAHAESASLRDSPKSIHRRSFLSKRESRQGTPS